MLEHLPENYDTREKAPARFCAQCRTELEFDAEDTHRWGCPCCDYIYHDSPQPVANPLIITDISDIHFVGDQLVLRAPKNPISPDHSQFVSVQRKHPPFPHKWALPGGFVNSFEDPQAAAHREAHEEVNLMIKLLRFLGACHPLRHMPHRFAMNQIVLSWLACLDLDGIPQAQDDAEDFDLRGQHRVEELVFGSHKYVGKNWFDSRYPWSPGITLPEAPYENLNHLADIQHCIRCAANLIWDEQFQRKRCEDVEGCQHIHWNSPVPFVRALLMAGEKVLLSKRGELWTLPDAPVSAYNTPRESMENGLVSMGEVSLDTNLAALKLDLTNRIDILFGGQLTPHSTLPEHSRIFPVDALPDDLFPPDRLLIAQHQNGHFDQVGTPRRFGLN